MRAEDVARLLEHVSPEQAAERLGTHACRAELPAGEREMAHRILRTILHGAEPKVRAVIARSVRTSAFLPRDIALGLAADIDVVAVPILEFSQILTDDDLLTIIDSGSTAKQIAIAGRHAVSRPVASAIVSTENGSAVARLVANEGAALDPALLQSAARRFVGHGAVVRGLRGRKDVPAAVLDSLVDFTIGSLKDFIASRTGLDADLVDRLVLSTREAALLESRNPLSPAEEAVQLAGYLNAAGRLTDSLVRRALCTGDLSLFEAAMAERARIPLHNARMLIHDPGMMGLHALCVKAAMPPEFLPVLRAALGIIASLQEEGRDRNQRLYRRMMLERLLSRYHADAPEDLPRDDMDYLLIRLNELRSPDVAMAA